MKPIFATGTSKEELMYQTLAGRVWLKLLAIPKKMTPNAIFLRKVSQSPKLGSFQQPAPPEIKKKQLKPHVLSLREIPSKFTHHQDWFPQSWLKSTRIRWINREPAASFTKLIFFCVRLEHMACWWSLVIKIWKVEFNSGFVFFPRKKGWNSLDFSKK